jgi:hypothetical protein
VRLGPGVAARGWALAACPTRSEQKAIAAAGRRWRRRVGAERPGPSAAACGQALAARPTWLEQKAAAVAQRSWRRRLGAEGGGWEPGPKNRVAGKKENVSGSFYGVIRYNFGGKMKKTHFLLLL